MVHYGKPLLNQQWWGFALGFITSEGSWNTLHGINISPTTALLSRWFFSPFGGFLEGSPLWDSPKLPNHCDWLEFRVFFFFFIAGKFQSAGVCKTCSPKWWCYFRRFLNDVFFKSTFLDVMFKGTYSKPCISQRWLYYTKILGYWPTQFSFILVPQIIGFFFGIEERIRVVEKNMLPRWKLIAFTQVFLSVPFLRLWFCKGMPIVTQWSTTGVLLGVKRLPQWRQKSNMDFF